MRSRAAWLRPLAYGRAVAAGREPAILYEEDEDGWIVASIPEVPGVFSQGRTRDEARVNVLDALQLMTSPEPDAIGEPEGDLPHA